MTKYKVTNTSRYPKSLGKERFDSNETKELDLKKEEVEQADVTFVFEEVSVQETDEEPDEVQESKAEEKSESENGGD